MSIWDNMKKFAQPYNDDEYDDYDDYDGDYEDEEVEEEPVRRAPRRATTRAARPARRTPPVEQESEPAQEEDFEDDYESSFRTIPTTPAAPAPAAASAPAASSFTGRVVNMNRNAATQEIVRIHPNSFQDSRKAASELVASKGVILNLENLDKDSSRRLVDFLSGVVFAMGGEAQKIAQNAYVFCPPNVVVTGGPEEVQAPDEDMA